MRFLIVFCCAAIASVYAAHFSYEAYKVYQVYPSNQNDVLLLKQLENTLEVDIWSSLRFRGKPVDIMVEPNKQSKFEGVLKKHGLMYHVRVNNVEENVQKERLMQARSAISRKGRISFTSFNRMAEIDAYLDQISSQTKLKVVKISTNPSANKPIIFIDAGIHAREWIAPAQALYIIQELVENSANIDLLNKVDWHILPVLNPDGYEYTHTSYRYWRKTVKPSGNGCMGTDGNRNYDFHWGGLGTSSNPCSDIYKGDVPFSEPETQNTKTYIEINKNRIKLYLTFHSYGGYLLYPWGYTSDLPPNSDQLHSLGLAVSSAIVDAGGEEFTVGSSTNEMGPGAGGSDDWAMGVAGINLSYTVEMPGPDFVIPPDFILPYVTQMFAGVRVYGQYVADNYA
ncbi:hypothetical protein FQA39_LY12212 [Lamprigera yunnana]|nr:hypothetical protein FQA39_LY12212 [Lamprigera yunnana]